MSRVLAISVDGLLQPLGYSQVARVVVGLARRGFAYSVVSLERARDLADGEHRAFVERVLADAGVRWRHDLYVEGGGGPAVLENLRRAARLACEAKRDDGVALVHARGYPPALVARLLRARFGVPYLFDARGYWIDELAHEGRRFTSGASFAIAKAIERDLYASAAGVVTLTELHASDVRSGALGPVRNRPVVCIPTCADFDEFRPAHGGARPPALAGLAQHARIIGVVGSLNRSYRAEETMALARRVLERDAAFHLVILSAQRDEYAALLRTHGIASDRVSLTAVPHRDMPAVVPHLDWAILLLWTGRAKRGSVPTKLAEFLASGVRVAYHGCNEEASGWVERTGAGLVLPSLDAASLDAAADAIVASPRRNDRAERVRALAEPHFSLRSGIDRYAEVLRALGLGRSWGSARPRSPMP